MATVVVFFSIIAVVFSLSMSRPLQMRWEWSFLLSMWSSFSDVMVVVFCIETMLVFFSLVVVVFLILYVVSFVNAIEVVFFTLNVVLSPHCCGSGLLSL